MKKSEETLRLKDTIKVAVLYIAFELSSSKWKLAFSDGSKVRYKTITAGNLAQLQVERAGFGKKDRLLSEDSALMNATNMRYPRRADNETTQTESRSSLQG